MHDIKGATCLDLFAGSGILSIEALSRGAKHVTLVEDNEITSSRILDNLILLQAEPIKFTNIKANAINWVKTCKARFDIIFIDPPFQSELLPELLIQISKQRIANKFIYLETPKELTTSTLPPNWNLYQQKRTGSVHYGLWITG